MTPITTHQGLYLLAAIDAMPLRTADGHRLGGAAITELWPMAARLRRAADELDRARIDILHRATAHIDDWPGVLRRWQQDPADPDTAGPVAEADRTVTAALAPLLDAPLPGLTPLSRGAVDAAALHLAGLDTVASALPVLGTPLTLTPEAILRALTSIADI